MFRKQTPAHPAPLQDVVWLGPHQVLAAITCGQFYQMDASTEQAVTIPVPISVKVDAREIANTVLKHVAPMKMFATQVVANSCLMAK